jgi:hypothetical protein
MSASIPSLDRARNQCHALSMLSTLTVAIYFWLKNFPGTLHIATIATMLFMLSLSLLYWRAQYTLAQAENSVVLADPNKPLPKLTSTVSIAWHQHDRTLSVLILAVTLLLSAVCIKQSFVDAPYYEKGGLFALLFSNVIALLWHISQPIFGSRYTPSPREVNNKNNDKACENSLLK